MRLKCRTAVLIVALMTNAWAAEYEVDQRNKAFSTVYLKVKVGDTVYFANNDPYFHDIFSLSETKPFDLGYYAQGERRQVTFDKAGAVFVECAIHPFMKMQIDVTQ